MATDPIQPSDATATAEPGAVRSLLQVQQEAEFHRREAVELRRRLAEVEAELATTRQTQAWLETALANQRHARQVLEATVSVDYDDTVARIGERVEALVPGQATVLVVSKGDPRLLELGERKAWHFPRADDGGYGGYNPADAPAAIEHLQILQTQGAEYLVIPHTSFWWLEHYRGWADYLEQNCTRIWRDNRCVIYQFDAPSCGSNRQTDVATIASTFQPAPASAAPQERFDVICLPVINWSYRFQRPQQLMRQFAMAGHRVFYLSHDFRKSGPPWQALQLAENLQEISLRGAGFKIRDGLMDRETEKALLNSLAALRRDQNIQAAAAIVQLSFWWPLAQATSQLFGWPVVYDCMDHQAGFSNHHPALLAQERELLTQARLVVASSIPLEHEARRLNANVLRVRNGCDYEHFARTLPRPTSDRPVIGYFGAIADWFDADLVADLAERRPEWDFILVGATVSADLSRLGKLPNVTLPGEKPYAEIPEWLARFDVTILPFKRNPLTHATNPVKAYEIFASGKPLVSVPLPEMVTLTPLARMAATAAEFETAIAEELLQPDPELPAERRAFARANTWRARYELLVPALNQLFPPATARLVPEAPAQR